MAKTSAGLLMYKIQEGKPLVFLVHPGGPFYAKKDLGTWSIPKGLVEQGEDIFVTAKREFTEETGFEVTETEFIQLGPAKRPDKIVHIWAFKGDFDPKTLTSNTCQIEFPPKSGRMLEIPEVDKGNYFTIEEAKLKTYAYFVPIIEEFQKKINLL